MKLLNMIILRICLVGLSLMSTTVMAQDNLSQQYCSNENTGSDFTPDNSIYMSNGKCFDYCSASYAFAVVQYQNCWCSNYVPANLQSTGNCNVKCPGFPSDLCGNAGAGLYGYIPLSIAPLGTAGTTSSAAPTSSPPPPQSTPPPVTSYTPSPSSSQAPISSAPISSASSSSSATRTRTPIPKTTIQIITKSGSVVTQTVTQTPVVVGGDGSGASASPDQMQVQQHPLSIGAVAGIVVGTLIGLAAILLAAFLIWRRKKNPDSEQGSTTSATRRPRRTTSVLSKTGLLSRNRPQSMVENNYDDNLYGPGGNSVRNSMMFGAGATVEGVSPLGGSQDNISSRRHSKPLVYDQRLNPSALFANQDANGSRVSIQDQNDYSRPLGVANPEFRASFDSR